MNFDAVRNVGDLVIVGGAYFDSIGKVTAFYEAIPNQVDFVIVTSNDPSVKVGETGRSYADLPVVQS